MRRTRVWVLVIAVVFFAAGTVFAAHKEEEGTIKGTATAVKVVEVEVTVKDESGRETKVRAKGGGDIKPGDRVVVKDGKVMKEIKPITGGY